jgi:hypothetical protein
MEVPGAVAAVIKDLSNRDETLFVVVTTQFLIHIGKIPAKQQRISTTSHIPEFSFGTP